MVLHALDVALYIALDARARGVDIPVSQNVGNVGRHVELIRRWNCVFDVSLRFDDVIEMWFAEVRRRWFCSRGSDRLWIKSVGSWNINRARCQEQPRQRDRKLDPLTLCPTFLTHITLVVDTRFHDLNTVQLHPIIYFDKLNNTNKSLCIYNFGPGSTNLVL
jgi:hypothetical protein